MKTTLFLSILLFAVAPAYAKEQFTARINIDQKKYIDDALRYLLEQRSSLSPSNLEIISLNYLYQPMPGSQSVCGPNGCEITPAAPFSEQLSVVFKIIDSKHEIEQGGQRYNQWDTISVQFPTPRMPQWFIGSGTSTSGTPIPETKKVEQDAAANP